MRTVLRFLARVDVGIGMLIAAAIIGTAQGMGHGLVFLAGCAALRWFVRTALGSELHAPSGRKASPPHRRSAPSRPQPPPPEHLVGVVARAPSDGRQASLDQIDPAWRQWLDREGGVRPPQ